MSDDYTSAALRAAANTTKETVGAQIVTSTLDTLNKNAKGKSKKSAGESMAASYDFNKSVLSAVYSPKGGITDLGS